MRETDKDRETEKNKRYGERNKLTVCIVYRFTHIYSVNGVKKTLYGLVVTYRERCPSFLDFVNVLWQQTS